MLTYLFRFNFYRSLCALGAVISTVLFSTNALSTSNSFVETNGLVVIEAEQYATQHLDDKRRWFVFDAHTPDHKYSDGDDRHLANASGDSYIELLPDTRVNHHETLVRGENFTSNAGSMAVLSYPVYFQTPGKYYIWARAYSSGSEDNGVHFGINGTWPESSKRLQFCQGKHQWTWSSAQRTKDNHCGTPQTITVEVPTAGVHNIMVSMREDGFELDKFILTRNKDYVPQGKAAKATGAIPPQLPEKKHLLGITDYKRILYAHQDFILAETDNYRWLPLPKHHALALTVIDKSNGKNIVEESAYASYTVDKKSAGYVDVTFIGLTNNTTDISVDLKKNNQLIGQVTLGKEAIAEQEKYFEFKGVTLKKGDVIQVGITPKPNEKVATTKELIGLWRAVVLTRSKE